MEYSLLIKPLLPKSTEKCFKDWISHNPNMQELQEKKDLAYQTLSRNPWSQSVY
ncbi:hypothetical protein [Commensalibacter papalotli (ex Botero et al. 2024)]|uniref:hypothetical protein n=1 Tax=Commensalibacter papalotli (ex Botero et al. 2024) TaxID=2972766 RepID=UPI002490DA2D|nr:hypothetical protein [Commensalibacter papalotli (ex Botero et al. 2024)]